MTLVSFVVRQLYPALVTALRIDTTPQKTFFVCAQQSQQHLIEKLREPGGSLCCAQPNGTKERAKERHVRLWGYLGTD